MTKPPHLTVAHSARPVLATVPGGAEAESRASRPVDAFAEKAAARAQLAAVYGGVLGVEVKARDLLDAMMSADGAAHDVHAQMIANAMGANGFVTEVTTVSQFTEDQWPALAHMTSGQFVLVLAQRQDELTIYDATCTDNRAFVPISDFAPYFTGLVVRAEAPLDRLADTHGAPTRRAHWFWGEFHRFRKSFAEVALGSFVANILAVSVALFSLQIYDRVIPHQSEATLWVLAIGAMIALVMEAGLKLARARLMDGAGRQIELNVQKVLMERLLGMRSDLKGQSPSQMFNAMREFSSVREFFTSSTIGTLADIPFIFVFLLLVASIAGNVVWVLIIGGILMVVPGVILQKRMIALTKETQGANAKSARLLHEAVFELDTIKAHRGEDRFRRLWSEMTALSAMKSSEQRRLASQLTFWSQGIQQATYLTAVIMGTYLVFAGQFTVGSIIAVGILTGRTLAPLTQLSAAMARWGNVKTALDGLGEIAEADQDEDETRSYLRRDTLQGRFELREVSYRYEPDGAPVLDIPGLVIQPGQKVAVLGANGSGKSTLLKVLSGLYAPEAGRVMIDGVEMSQIAPRDLRRMVGYLGQDVRLFSGTLRDNVNLHMLEKDDDRLYAALDFAGLGQFVKGHHKGLDLEIRDGGQGLSIGQRQSIGWARLWLQDPKILLLDEPTAALDQTLEATLVSRLADWMKGRTAVIATHRVPILALTERTVILQNGRLAVDGPREAVLEHLTRAGGTDLQAREA